VFEDKPLTEAVNNLAKQIKASAAAVNSTLKDINSTLIQQGDRIVSHLAELENAVAAMGTVVTSAVTLIEGLAAKLIEFQNDPAKIAELAAQLTAEKDALAAAVAAGTTP
jgi:transcriptional antiterminator